ncbi:phage holin [Lysinibacillus fusiformis]|uniref:phage holin n=1 Tax=Lysinibacillus fusiformis TaxID=28031 RepID=UPI003D020E85
MFIVATIISTYAFTSLFGVGTTIYNEKAQCLALLVLFGVVSDATTPGLNDSERVESMTYKR